MNATAAVPGWFEVHRGGYAFRQIEGGENAEQQCDWGARAASLRNLLGRDGHTITQISSTTRCRYGHRSPYFIPSSFLYQLSRGVTPHVCQVVALSESTGYRFVDWLRMFGFDLYQIARLQIRLHPQRTTLVTPIENYESFRPQSLFGHAPSAPAAFCHERGGSSAPRPGEWSGQRRHWLVKIGSSDAAGCPMLSPGDILRVDRYYSHRVRGLDPVSMSRLLWLVEQPSGLTCTRVRWIDDRQIVLLPSRPPWGSWPLHLPTEARILGLVNTEVHPPQHVGLQPRAGPANPEPFLPPSPEGPLKFSDLLRVSRGRAGLTFRAAQQLTRAIARILGNREYGIALGMLSDYEAMGRLPRHITKILSLCMVYCMDVRELMESAGVRIDDSAKLSLPISDGRLAVPSELLEYSAHSGTSGIVDGYARAAAARP
jgi:hypothetical protein